MRRAKGLGLWTLGGKSPSNGNAEVDHLISSAVVLKKKKKKKEKKKKEESIAAFGLRVESHRSLLFVRLA